MQRAPGRHGGRAAAALATLAALLAGVAAVVAPGSAVAARASGPFTLATGGVARIAGSAVACTATGGASGRGVLCALAGAGGGQPAGSLGVALSERGEALVVRFTAKGAAEAWRVPAVHRRAAASGAAAPLSGARPVAVGGAWQVALTAIRCDVRRAGALPGVVCSLVGDDGLVRPGTNSIAMTGERVGIYRYDGRRRAAMKVEEAQPARVLRALRSSPARHAQALRRPQAARSALAPPRRAPALSPIAIAVGDTLQIPGSRVTCLVTRDASAPAVFCLLAALTTPLPNSYAVGLTRDGTAILVAYDAKSRGALLRRYTQAARAVRAAPPQGRLVLARFGSVYRVAGTDILCTPVNAGHAGIACTLNGPHGRIVGSTGIALVDGLVARIFQITGRTSIRTLVQKAEPGAGH